MKIKLKNGIEIDNIISIDKTRIDIKSNDVKTIYDLMTEDNLRKITVESFESVVIYENLKFDRLIFDGENITVLLGEVDIVTKRLNALDDTLETLMEDIIPSLLEPEEETEEEINEEKAN